MGYTYPEWVFSLLGMGGGLWKRGIFGKPPLTPLKLRIAEEVSEKVLHPRNSTWNLEMMVSNRNLLFQGSISRFHVCFGGCTCIQICDQTFSWNAALILYKEDFHQISLNYPAIHPLFEVFAPWVAEPTSQLGWKGTKKPQQMDTPGFHRGFCRVSPRFLHPTCRLPELISVQTDMSEQMCV